MSNMLRTGRVGRPSFVRGGGGWQFGALVEEGNEFSKGETASETAGSSVHQGARVHCTARHLTREGCAPRHAYTLWLGCQSDFFSVFCCGGPSEASRAAFSARLVDAGPQLSQSMHGTVSQLLRARRAIRRLSRIGPNCLQPTSCLRTLASQTFR